MTRIAAAATALPEHRYAQEDITRAFAAVVHPGEDKLALLDRFHRATGVETRHLALALEDYAGLDFTAANDAFVRVAVELGERAVRSALERAGLEPADVDLVISTTVTGLAVPSVDARLVGRLGLRPDVRRLPLFGLGCVAGAAGIARAADHLAGHPDDVVVLLAVELCSLTVQRDDDSVPNLIGSGLFGDGAGAVVLVGERRAERMGLAAGAGTPAVVDSQSAFYPDTERVMGWDIGSTGFRLVLAASVADVVEEHLARDVKGFLSGHDLDVSDIRVLVGHPGGPKVLDTVTRVLGLAPDALQHSWDSMREAGNLSSVSVISVLERTVAAGPPAAHDPGLLFAMGPGFCSELVLLDW
ncbi:isopalmitoylresorcinol synthase [Motilibacter rhizosphaerae]|uniref:Isopalmitoylresorcinol synthase n=1 Tax=Motilibacter rhizosphaerae TaxID=598652 RepID=A0A4Q7NB60_9ACTN|nr:3-oxoacyl-[acyl-carrier-protein] synthase III C-terminal domain-containing protein [Motilibacter rhizosphaerae]RZS80202.1 isopalmitoylresorcinol synthase [Motilibacter rhizosphaerae]